MVYIVFCYFIFLFFYTKKKYTRIAIFLVAVYTFSILFSIILYNSDIDYRYTSLSASIVFCVTLLFYFIPFFKKDLKIDSTYDANFLKRFTIIGYCLSIILIIGCLFLLTKIQEAMAYGLVELRQDTVYKGEEVLMNYSLIEHIGHSILRWLGGLSYSALIMFFYAFLYIKKKYLLKILLILSSLSTVYLGLLNGGRTNLIYWTLFFIFCLILFWSYFTPKKKKLILVITLVFLLVLSSYFIFITVKRVELGSGYGMSNFLISYIGQPYLNFCDFFDNMNYHPYTLRRIFPLTSSLLSGRFNLSDYRDLIFFKSNMNIGVFYTHLGDLYVDVGIVGMFLYSVLFFLISKKMMKKEVFSLSDLLILGILYQIPLHGIFYYSLWRMESTTCVLLTILIAKFLGLKKSVKW
jgi:oligosaccharide repeat unit polymerase